MPEKMRFMDAVRVGGGAWKRVFIEEHDRVVKSIKKVHHGGHGVGFRREAAIVSPSGQLDCGFAATVKLRVLRALRGGSTSSGGVGGGAHPASSRRRATEPGARSSRGRARSARRAPR